ASTNNLRVRGKVAFPEIVAEDNHGITPRYLVLVGTEAPSQVRAHAQNVKEIAAHQRPEFHLRLRRFVWGEAKLEILRGGQTREGIALLLEIFEIRVGHTGVLEDASQAFAAELRLDHHDAGRVRHGQARKQDIVRQTEDSRIGPNPQSQRNNRD